jgi:hypothetical protein
LLWASSSSFSSLRVITASPYLPYFSRSALALFCSSFLPNSSEDLPPINLLFYRLFELLEIFFIWDVYVTDAIAEKVFSFLASWNYDSYPAWGVDVPETLALRGVIMVLADWIRVGNALFFPFISWIICSDKLPAIDFCKDFGIYFP